MEKYEAEHFAKDIKPLVVVKKTAAEPIKLGIKDLRGNLWDKNWNRFWMATENINGVLKDYRSVSILPENTSVEDLKRVDQVLAKAADALEEAFMVIKKLKV